MSKELVVVGAFHEIFELAEESDYKIIGFFDNKILHDYNGYEFLGTDDHAKQCFPENKPFIIITPDQPEVRKKLANYYGNLKYQFGSLISAQSRISKSATINEGTVIQALVNVSSNCVIGKHVKLNTSCNIMHDTVIGDYTSIAPNAVILGNVKIGTSCYIGANSTILPHISIADHTVIGAGATVTKNIEIPGKYIGCPARRMKS